MPPSYEHCVRPFLVSRPGMLKKKTWQTVCKRPAVLVHPFVDNCRANEPLGDELVKASPFAGVVGALVCKNSRHINRGDNGFQVGQGQGDR